MTERGITGLEIQEALQRGRMKKYDGDLTSLEYKNLYIVFNKFFNNNVKEDGFVIVTAYRPNRSLENKIDQIPYPHPWWKKEGRQVFVDQAHFLVDSGVDEDMVISLLKSLYTAACGEFGV